MPNAFATTPEGLLFIASGMDPMVKWDGLASQAVTVGVVAPTTALTISGSGSGSISGTYTAYQRFVDALGNFSNLSPISNSITLSSVLQVDYSSVPLPTETKVVRRQILRNTSGQADTYYVDVDSTDLGATTFSSTKTDAQLSAETEVPIFNPDGSLNANRFGIPPNHKTTLAHHLGRMFAAGEVEYSRGCVQVTNASATVTGIGTEWTSSLEGRFLWVAGAPARYEIDSVDVTNQTLTLTEVYQGTTDRFAGYGIRPAPAEFRLIYYTEAGLPEAWPVVNALSLQEDGDEITGLYTNGSFLYILERKHIYRLTFQEDPAVDGAVFMGAHRGCVNHRCFVVIEDIAYMMDEVGIHAFDGSASNPISQPIQSVFKGEGDNKINWRASRWFHCVHYPPQDTIRWFVCLGGDYLPRHALVYDFRRQSWWIEEFTHPIGSSAAGLMNGEPMVFLGSESQRIFAFWQGTLDGPDPAEGTVRGTVTSAAIASLTDSSADFASDGLVGSPLCIVSGTGKGQVRTITEVSGTTLKVKEPWLELPDTTSVYQVGGVRWQYRTGVFRFLQDEQNNPRRIEVLFNPVDNDALMDLRLFLNRSDTPADWTADYALDDGRGFSTITGEPDAEADLTKNDGLVQHRIDGSGDYYLDKPRFIQLELGGFTNKDKIAIVGATIDGVAQ